MFAQKITCIYIYTYITNTYLFHHLTASQSAELPLPIPDKPAKVSGFAPWWITFINDIIHRVDRVGFICFSPWVFCDTTSVGRVKRWHNLNLLISVHHTFRFISQKSEGASLEGFGQVSAKKLVYWLYVYMFFYISYNQSSKIGWKNVPFFS